MKVYNSLTHQKEEFIPLKKGEIKMYSCGITVSKDAHIGHAIQAMIFDIMRKYFEKKGYKVIYARNYTDVDDKIIDIANQLGINPMEHAERLIKKTDDEMHKLGISDATLTLRATEYIPQIIEFVNKLIEKGYAYATPEGDVYFRVSKFKDYGKLSHRTLEDALESVRIDNEKNKETPFDFALWKSAKPNEIYWESPWGKGRPGWHIECSAMNYYGLGEQIDIHGGGRDLIFPHHENEIAQTESLTGKQFAKYWFHNGLVKVNGQKMSKSLNNSILIEDILKKYHPEIIRFALLQTNYKNDVNITDDLFAIASKHMIDFYKTLAEIESKNLTSKKENKLIEKSFDDAMDDDFNTAKALANLFDIFKTMNNKLRNSDESVIEDYNAVKNVYGLLGLFKLKAKDFLKQTHKEIIIPDYVIELADKRLEARKLKNWKESDELREKIKQNGFDIIDNKDGYKLEKIN